MKIIAIVLLLVLLAGCTSKTEFGDCIGAFDDKDPHLVYHASAWNIFLAIIGVQFIAPPIFVIADETLCPVGVKP